MCDETMSTYIYEMKVSVLLWAGSVLTALLLQEVSSFFVTTNNPAARPAIVAGIRSLLLQRPNHQSILLQSHSRLDNQLHTTQQHSPGNISSIHTSTMSWLRQRQLLKNMTPHWILASSLAVWFLFVHSPPILLQRSHTSPLFVAHLLGSYILYCVCTINALITPAPVGVNENSIFTRKKCHCWLGSTAMLAGVVGFVGGLLVIVTQWQTIDRGFAIGVTIGGLLQLQCQWTGYRAIQRYRVAKQQLLLAQQTNALATNQHKSEERQQLTAQRDGALKEHISQMIALFVMACGIPAVMRLASASLGIQSAWGIVALIGLMNVLAMSYESALTKGLGRVSSKQG